jgi:hypothetical protein
LTLPVDLDRAMARHEEMPHPDKDRLKDVDDAEAKDLLVFLDDFMRYIYDAGPPRGPR